MCTSVYDFYVTHCVAIVAPGLQVLWGRGLAPPPLFIRARNWGAPQYLFLFILLGAYFELPVFCLNMLGYVLSGLVFLTLKLMLLIY